MSVSQGSPALLSMTVNKAVDSRSPITVEVMLTDKDGNGHVVYLDEHDFARFMSGSVVETKSVQEI